MTVQAMLKHYSMASDGKVQIKVDNGVHTFSKKAINEMIENDAPILKKTLGLLMVADGDLVITAY